MTNLRTAYQTLSKSIHDLKRNILISLIMMVFGSGLVIGLLIGLFIGR